MSVTVSLLLIGVLIAADQLIKLWALASLAPLHSITLIEGLLSLTYVENRGAAFGIFQGQRWLLVGVTLIVISGMGYMLVSGKAKNSIERLCLSLIIAGGTGNLVDRMLRGFVVDYIDINALFRYPMFNLADCCVVIGAALMLVCVFLEEKNQKKQQAEGGEKTIGEDTTDGNN